MVAVEQAAIPVRPTATAAATFDAAMAESDWVGGLVARDCTIISATAAIESAATAR